MPHLQKLHQFLILASLLMYVPLDGYRCIRLVAARLCITVLLLQEMLEEKAMTFAQMFSAPGASPGPAVRAICLVPMQCVGCTFSCEKWPL